MVTTLRNQRQRSKEKLYSRLVKVRRTIDPEPSDFVPLRSEAPFESAKSRPAVLIKQSDLETFLEKDPIMRFGTRLDRMER